MKIYLPIALLALVSIIACNSAQNNKAYLNAGAEYKENAPPSNKEPADGVMMSSSAAVENNTDSTRHFIRTASLKYRVKDVRLATNDIEDITAHFKGYVEQTKLESTIDRTTTTPVSADSSLETVYYTTYNNMTLRVPNTKLDSTLRAMSYLVDFLDSRSVQAKDIRIELLANKLTMTRLKHHIQRVETDVDDKGQKLRETTNAEEKLLNAQEQSDMTRLDNIKQIDSIKYSTIVLNIYQRQTFKHTLLANEKDIRQYEPGFFTKLKEAFITGWHGVEELVLMLVDIWWFLILVAAMIFGYQRYKTYINKRQKKQ